MATEFRMNVSRVSFPLVIDGEDAEGNAVVLFEKRYSLDLGNKEKIKQIYTACKSLSEKAKALEENEEALDKIEELSQGIIQSALGDWDAIWEASGHNVYAMMALAFQLAKVIKEDSTGTMKRYGF
jgi:hypothetical protein